jgi:hypothetical protein
MFCTAAGSADGMAGSGVGGTGVSVTSSGAVGFAVGLLEGAGVTWLGWHAVNTTITTIEEITDAD